MKHVFHIHSYVNYITALGVISKLEIKNEDVILSISRNIPLLNNDYTYFNIEDKLYYHLFNSLKHLHLFKWIRNDRVIKELDEKVKVATGDEKYCYYCPHSRGYLYQVFITNPRCVEVNYIEDGMDAFLTKDAHEDKFPFKIKFYQKLCRNTLFRLPIFKRTRLGMFDNAFKPYKGQDSKLYVLTNDSFKNIPYVNTYRVDLNEVTNVNIPGLEKSKEIFLFDAVVEQGVVSQLLLKDFIVWFCKYFKNLQELRIKFHPFQGSEHRDWIISVFTDNEVNIECIDDSVPMEYVLAKSENLDIYGIGSSLLLYATKFSKHKVTVLYPYFKKVKNHDSIRDVYWEGAFRSETSIKLLGRDFDI